MARKSKESIVYGVGINDADYQVSKGSWRCPFYKHWKNMLARCYSPAFQRNQPLYIGCSVDPRWHRFSHFRAWMETQDWEGKQLDKDRKVLGNKVYGPDTCLWLTRKENVQARSITKYVMYKGFWVHLKSFCGEDTALYSYVTKKLNETVDIDEILAMREHSRMGKVVSWDGTDIPLKTLCDLYQKDYDVVLQRLSTWSKSTPYACVIYDTYPHYRYDLTTNNGVNYQFCSVNEISELLQCSVNMVKLYLNDCDNNLDNLDSLIQNHQEITTDRRSLYTINGISTFREEWIRFYETSEPRVEENMWKYKLPFEDAVQLPVERVVRLLVNGKVIRVKDFWEQYGLNAKAANRVRSEKNLTYKQTLTHFGVQFDKSLEVSPL